MAQRVQHLSGHHALGAAGFGQDQRRFNAVVGRKPASLQDQTESLRLHGVARQHCQRFSVDLVVGGLAPTQIVVIHAGQIIMDQGVVVHQLQCAAVGKRQMPVDTAQTGKLQRQHGTDPFAAGQQTVANGFLQPAIGLVLSGKNGFQIGFDGLLVGTVALLVIHI